MSVDGVLILNRMVVARGLGRWTVEGGTVIKPTDASQSSMIEMEKDVREPFPTVRALRPVRMQSTLLLLLYHDLARERSKR